MALWLTKVQFGMGFWLIGYFFKNAFKKNEVLRQQFEGRKSPIQLKVAEEGLNYFICIENQALKYGFGELQGENPLTVTFQNALQCKTLIKGKDANQFMKAVSEKKINITGDFSILMHLMSTMKLVKEAGQNKK